VVNSLIANYMQTTKIISTKIYFYTLISNE
jgi:hypothetical protein